MTITIDFSSPAEEAAIKAQAASEGMNVKDWLRKIARERVHLAEAPEKPFETGRGLFAKYGPAPSAEEIDANRTDMFRNFAQDF